MHKKIVTREEVNEILVSDNYFKKGNLTLKIWQSILTLLSWMGVFLPFIWILFPVFYPKKANQLNFYLYPEEITTFRFLLKFFLIVFLLILVGSISLTIWNNYRYKNILEKTITIDENSVANNNNTLEKFYSERFGEQSIREEIRYYSVIAEKNITDDDIINLYRKEIE